MHIIPQKCRPGKRCPVVSQLVMKEGIQMSDKFIRAEDVAKELDISKAYAYKLIQKMNAELREKGYLTIAGRINRQYFAERFYGIRSAVNDALGKEES